MNDMSRPALRYHGGKFRLAGWIQSFFPGHTCYVEPFGGAAGVLLQKARCYAEVYNDLDGMVVNFFRVLRDPVLRQRLIDAVIATPYARDEFTAAWDETDEPIELARRLCIRAQMGFGSAGATKSCTGFRIDTKREYGTAQHLWAQYPATLATVGERFAGVLIENRPAVEVMSQHDAPETLHYVDPPYVHSTRTRPRTGGYRHELTDGDHIDLLTTLKALKGYVVLSGYDTSLYNDLLPGWSKYSTSARISAFRGSETRNEVVWVNPRCGDALAAEAAQQRLFA